MLHFFRGGSIVGFRFFSFFNHASSISSLNFFRVLGWFTQFKKNIALGWLGPQVKIGLTQSPSG